MEVKSMRSLLGVLVVGGSLFLVACGDDFPTGPSGANSPTSAATATPTPRPTAPPTLVGRWVIANSGINREHVLWNWTVDIQSHNTATGEVRGLSYLTSLGGPGALRGTARGSHIDWQTDYGDGDTENGSMDLALYPNGVFLEGFVKFELPNIKLTATFHNAQLRRE